jgi:hypothetical protein
MPNDSHQRAAEFHEQAAHAHRAAAVHHGKEDHLTGHEHSKQAMEFSFKAHQASQFAHEKSPKAGQVISRSNASTLEARHQKPPLLIAEDFYRPRQLFAWQSASMASATAQARRWTKRSRRVMLYFR